MKLFVLVGIITVLIVNCSFALMKNPMKRFPTLEKLKSSKGRRASVEAATVQQMIERLIPGRGSEFAVSVNYSLSAKGRDVFVLRNAAEGVIGIEGSSGVAAAWGFHYYAKVYGGCLFSWSGNQVASLPSPPPALAGSVRVAANDYFRYYQNVCTVSYSSVWWNWSRWEQEIDWMALNAINLPLAFTGQEEIFRRVYLRLGFGQRDMDAFFSGPAFFAWQRMGNIDGWGGPLPDSFYLGQLQLQHQILQRMRDFGMIPVLPAFSGHVPASIRNYYPDVNVTKLGNWGNFNSTYCCTSFLDPRDPLFQTIGQSLIQELEKEFGTDHIYNCDTFNEMTPPSTDPQYFTEVGRATYDAMAGADPDAVWLMQGWLFLSPFWTPELVKAYVTSVPTGKMIILDLYAENIPRYQSFESYYGQPFIWCMLQNFGGVKGLYGTVDLINNGPFVARAFPNSTMVGTGLTMEGIEQNDIMYEFMNEMAYLRTPVVPDVWITDWTTRRYGRIDADAAAAWLVLSHSALNCKAYASFNGNYVITRRPNFNLNYNFCYNVTYFIPAWDYIVTASRSSVSASDLFRHDLVDLSREALVIISTLFYSFMEQSYTDKNVTTFLDNSYRFLDALDDLETILATDRRFLLGTWLESAKSWSTNPAERELYEYNARNQITLWGPTGNVLDYATKQWSGVVADYFTPRWQLFVDQVSSALSSGQTFDYGQFAEDVFANVETPFTYYTDVYPTRPVGDPVLVAGRIYDKWRSVLSSGRLESLASSACNEPFLGGISGVTSKEESNEIT